MPALKAQAQQVERLRYRAALAERQFDQVDPDNRLVAAELERRWEETLRDLRQAEAALADAAPDEGRVVPFGIGPDLQAAFTEVGRRLPDLWQQPALTTARKKALLRCLIDKVVIHRAVRDTIALRLVWRGGATSEIALPITVGSLAELSRSGEMEAAIVERARAGESDAAIAAALTAAGHRSPLRQAVLPSTVQAIRLRHGILRERRQSHPRRIPGYLTVSQLAARLGVTPHWIYDRIYNGTIAIELDAKTGLYLFPDGPDDLARVPKAQSRQGGPPLSRPSVGLLRRAVRCVIEQARSTNLGPSCPSACATGRMHEDQRRLVLVILSSISKRYQAAMKGYFFPIDAQFRINTDARNKFNCFR